MIIPFAALLIPYGLFLIILLVMAFFHFYHVFKYGFGDKKLFVGTFIYVSLIAIILFFTAQLLQPIDWTAPLIDLTGLVSAFTTSRF